MEAKALYQTRNGPAEEVGALPMPTAVKIGGHEWTIEEKRHLIQDEEKYGQTVETRLLIEIDPRTPATKLRVTVLHELLHAIEMTFIEVKVRSKETNIKTLADGLFEVLVRNPSLVTFLFAPRECIPSEGQTEASRTSRTWTT